MAYTVILNAAARKALAKLSTKVRERILRALIFLEKDPYHSANIKKLEGLDNAYRLRVGDYRVLYEIQGERLVVLVIRIAHRREAYRR
ncbi:MAG: type II toxin-antitoxin system RelE/ParE family toxin [Candidatus Competibacteraceae bacterium]